MTSSAGGLVESARRLVGRGRTPVGERLEALAAAAATARGRVGDDLVDHAEAVVRRASGRLALSGDHTVVALAGATGSGKSSTFNALAGVELTAVGVRRPTTSATTALTWGDDEPVELLDWLQVPRRHRVGHTDPADPAPAPSGRGPGWDPDLDGLVLLDLPDHDSTEVAHHLEVDRLVQMVDLMIWVVDPQKYADAALHERYLRPLATHRGVIVLVLNHIDEVAPDRRTDLVADLTGRLEEDGLHRVPVLTTSARHGEGVAELRALVARRVREKRSAAERLAADITAAASALASANGEAQPGTLRRADRAELVEALSDAAGVPTVVHAVERAVGRRATQHTGWPFTAWLRRLRPDPLKRLHLDLGSAGRELTGIGRASVPEPTRVQRARVDTAVRGAADAVGAQLSPPWSRAVRRASVSRLDALADALDRAVAGTDLGASRIPVWWRIARLLQLLLALAVLVGALWLGALAVLGYLQMPAPDPPEEYGLPVPTLLLIAGLAGGLALAVLAKVVNRFVARSRARSARRRLRAAIGAVADDLVVAPIDAELKAYAEVRESLERALR